MGFGESEWGFTYWGDGDDLTVAGFTLRAVEILSNNTLLINFSESLSKSLANYSATSYTIPGLTVRSVVQPLDDVSPTEVILVTDKLSAGQGYTLSAAGLESSTGNAFDDTRTVTFTGRRTKLDKALTGTPILYDTSPTSVVRQLMTAIYREDDKIGGSEEEE